MKTLTFSLLIAFLMLSGCTERARQKLSIKPAPALEKVVIIDCTDILGRSYHYKVKRIEKGVVTFIDDDSLYTKGDTIFHSF